MEDKKRGVGRPPIPRFQFKVWVETADRLQKVPGKTWNDKMMYLLKKQGF